MRLIKVFSLAVVAALAAMAFAGASSASAESTVLCKEDTASLSCPVDKQASHVHFISPKANTQRLNEILNVSCTLLFLGDTVGGTLSQPILIEGSLTFTNCTFGCTYSEKNGPGLFELLKTATELGSLTGQFLVNVNCFGFFNCNYVGEGLIGHVLGGLAVNPTIGGPGHITFVEALVESESSESCPETATLDALFISLEALYIRS